MGIRSFIALPVPAEVTSHLGRLHESVPPSAGRIRWVRAGSMHLTCTFLGDIEESQIEPIGTAMSSAVTGIEPFATSLDGVGAFPNFRNPRVVWIGYADGESETVKLKSRLDEFLEPLGFEPERRRFHPHLTLGRIKEAGERGVLERAAAQWVIPFENWITRELILFRSILNRQGATYEPLVRVELGRDNVGPG
jgi:2'-5' RNA ligase